MDVLQAEDRLVKAQFGQSVKPVKEGFQYSSDTNPELLDARGLQTLLSYAFA